MHGVLAFCLMGGHFLGLFFWSLNLLHSPEVPKTYARITTGLMLAGPLIFLFSQASNLISGRGFEDAIAGEGPWYSTIPFCQWMLMFGIYGAFVWMSVGLKAKPHNEI